MGKMRTMGRRGDTTLVWGEDTATADEEFTDEATVRAQFDAIVKDQGFTAFSTRTVGEPADRVTEFDPNAKELILVPPMAGGAS